MLDATERVRFLFRYWHRARQVLRAEGPVALLRKIERRLGRTGPNSTPAPVLLDLREPFEPLAFRPHAEPAVSVVIPAVGSFRYTHHCLAALLQQAAAVPFEVIVVDDSSADSCAIRLAGYDNVRVLVNERPLGLLQSCNHGAEAARGELLVFLRNETQVQPGWLDTLVESFRLRQDAGLVGSRLLYPSGFQEGAGGIVWQDGSASLYGDGEDPGDPRYSYFRAVDFCPLVGLGIRRRLFADLGGFNEAYASSTLYASADLAFRVRAQGRGVYCQPLCLVARAEERISGSRSTAADGARQHPAGEAAQQFFRKWQDAVRSHGPVGEGPDQEKDRGLSGRILVVDTYMLTPDRESGSLRMVNLFSVLQEMGWQVTFAALGLDAREPYRSSLQARGIECLYRPYVRSVREHMRHHGQRYDVVLLSRADTAAELMTSALRWCSKARVVFDTVDLHFLRESREAEILGDRRAARLGEMRRREEYDLIKRAHVTLVVSEAERALLAEAMPDVDVRVLSNIHEIFGSARPFAQRRDLLFIGGFGHPPNTDAVLFFAKHVLPRVRERIPELVLYVIGSDPAPEIKELASEYLRILGYVPDVKPYLDTCRISVAPLRFGAGVKGKVNQSLAHGLPVVVTSIAAEGMFLKHGESALIADDPHDFAEAVVRLYCDEELWCRLSAGGIAVMEQHFSFSAARRAVTQLVSK